jgi:hypothetical protein
MLRHSPYADPATSSPDHMIPSGSGLDEFNPAFNQAVLITPQMVRGQAAAPPTGRRLTA